MNGAGDQGTAPVDSGIGRAESRISSSSSSIKRRGSEVATQPRMRFYYGFLRYLCQIGFVIYFRGRVFGLSHVPATGPVLVACNHQSFFDPVSATLAIPRECNYMARDTLFLNPFFGRFISSVNAFPVKRGAGDVGAVKEILRRLRDGKVVLVFPEGTRTRDGSIGRINPNSLLIAKKAGAAIVPAVVDGAFEAWPRTQLLPSPQSIHVTHCEALSAEQVKEWPIERIAAVVEERMGEGMKRSRERRL